MDGFEDRWNVFVIAATNRPDIIDQAMLWPGRLDKLLQVPLPKTADDRFSILQTHIRGKPIHEDVKLEEVSSHEKLNGYSGADLAMLVREASINAIQWVRGSEEDPVITMADF